MEHWPTISSTKLGAAKRQLDAAIRMLFSHDDALSIHTLAFSAYGLLSDLSKAAGGTETWRNLERDAQLREGKEFWAELKKLANFLKHADNDPDAEIHDVPEEFNEVALLINCSLLRELDELSSPETQALWLWFHANYFIDIDDAPSEYWDWIDRNYRSFNSEIRNEMIDIANDLYQCLKKTEILRYKMNPQQRLLPWRFVIRPSIGSKTNNAASSHQR